MSDTHEQEYRWEQRPLLRNPNSVAASCGKAWWSMGFAMFKRDGWVWVGSVIVFMLVVGVLSYFADDSAVLNLVIQLLSTVLYAGLFMGCRAVEQGQPMTVSYLFAGFQYRFSALMGLGALYLAALVVLMLAGMLLGAMGVAINQSILSVIVLGLVMFAVMLGLGMAFWFAPVLLMMHEELSVIDAFKLSFAGCIENLGALTVYGLIFVGLAIVATLLLGLGWLVLMPLCVTSAYMAYKDLFLAWPGEGGSHSDNG